MFLSSANEEVEPFHRLPVPLVTVRQLRALERTDGIVGVKEYYGLVPDPYDVNLNAAAAYFANSGVTDDEVLVQIARAFGSAAPWLPEVWRLRPPPTRSIPGTPPWFTRELGRSEPLHELSEAILRGQQSSATEWDTPAWRSTRGSIFMRTNNKIKEHPWLLEDVGLRFRLAGDLMRRALEIFDTEFVDDGSPMAVELGRQHNDDIVGFITRTTALSSHIRESALAAMLRDQRRPELVTELRALLVADLENQRRELERRKTAIGPFPEPLPAYSCRSAGTVDPRTDVSPIEQGDRDPRHRPRPLPRDVLRARAGCRGDRSVQRHVELSCSRVLGAVLAARQPGRARSSRHDEHPVHPPRNGASVIVEIRRKQ